MLNALLCLGNVNSFLIGVKCMSNPYGAVLSGADCTARPHKTFLKKKYELPRLVFQLLGKEIDMYLHFCYTQFITHPATVRKYSGIIISFKLPRNKNCCSITSVTTSFIKRHSFPVRLTNCVDTCALR